MTFEPYNGYLYVELVNPANPLQSNVRTFGRTLTLFSWVMDIAYYGDQPSPYRGMVAIEQPARLFTALNRSVYYVTLSGPSLRFDLDTRLPAGYEIIAMGYAPDAQAHLLLLRHTTTGVGGLARIRQDAIYMSIHPYDTLMPVDRLLTNLTTLSTLGVGGSEPSNWWRLPRGRVWLRTNQNLSSDAQSALYEFDVTTMSTVRSYTLAGDWGITDPQALAAARQSHGYVWDDCSKCLWLYNGAQPIYPNTVYPLGSYGIWKLSLPDMPNSDCPFAAVPVAPPPMVIPTTGRYWFQARIRSEILTRYPRPAFDAEVHSSTDMGKIVALTIPDGTVQQALLPSNFGELTSLFLRSDKPLQVYLGPPAQNTPLTISPEGMMGLIETSVHGPDAVYVTHDTGTGETANVVLYATGAGGGTISGGPGGDVTWTWLNEYREPVDARFEFYPEESYLDPWEVRTWGDSSYDPPSLPLMWSLYGSGSGEDRSSPATTYGVLNQTTPIQGTGSLQLKHGFWVPSLFGPKRVTGLDLHLWIDLNMPQPSIYTIQQCTKARLRTLLRSDVPPTFPSGTGVHLFGTSWNGQWQQNPATNNDEWVEYAFYFELPVNTGTMSGWRFGVWHSTDRTIESRGTFVQLQQGTLTPAIAAGEVIAWEVLAEQDDVNARWLHYTVSYKRGTDFTGMTALIDTTLHEGDVTSVRVPLPTSGVHLLGVESYACPTDGTMVMNLDQTEIMWQQSSAHADAWYMQWTEGSGQASMPIITPMLNPWTPIRGSGSLRVRRNRKYDFYPSALTAGRKYTSLRMYSYFYFYRLSPQRGRIRLLVRPDMTAGTRTVQVGMAGMLSEYIFTDAQNHFYALLYTLDLATAQWTNLDFVYFNNGIQSAQSLVQRTARPAAALGQVVSMQFTWRLDTTANTLELQAHLGHALDYSDLAMVMTYQGAAVYLTDRFGGTFQAPIPSFLHGEGPMVLFDYDGGAGDFDLSIDDIEQDREVPL